MIDPLQGWAVIDRQGEDDLTRPTMHPGMTRTGLRATAACGSLVEIVVVDVFCSVKLVDFHDDGGSDQMQGRRGRGGLGNELLPPIGLQAVLMMCDRCIIT